MNTYRRPFRVDTNRATAIITEPYRRRYYVVLVVTCLGNE